MRLRDNQHSSHQTWLSSKVVLHLNRPIYRSLQWPLACEVKIANAQALFCVSHLPIQESKKCYSAYVSRPWLSPRKNIEQRGRKTAWPQNSVDLFANSKGLSNFQDRFTVDPERSFGFCKCFWRRYKAGPCWGFLIFVQHWRQNISHTGNFWSEVYQYSKWRSL